MLDTAQPFKEREAMNKHHKNCICRECKPIKQAAYYLWRIALKATDSRSEKP